MKLKYHKIKNTPLDICTAEAVIAYNYAFSNGDLFKRRYSACNCHFQQTDIIREAVAFIVKQISNNDRVKTKYNVDTIFCCLNAGLEEYISKKCPIFTNDELLQADVTSIDNVFEDCKGIITFNIN